MIPRRTLIIGAITLTGVAAVFIFLRITRKEGRDVPSAVKSAQGIRLEPSIHVSPQGEEKGEKIGTTESVDRAYAYLKERQTEGAEEIFSERLAANPNDTEGHLGMGVVNRLKGNTEEAITELNEALKLEPNNINAKYNIAEILTFEKREGLTPEDINLAENYYNDLLQQKPGHPDLQNGLASVYFSTGRLENAIGVWEKTAQEHPDNTILSLNLTGAYLTGGRLDDALTHSKMILEKNPDNSDATYLMGAAEYMKGNTTGGIELIEKATSLNPNNPLYQAKLRELQASNIQKEVATPPPSEEASPPKSD